MADTLKVRIRDGCRGGSEHFKWNSIKDQEFKDREQYLGASTKVGMMTKFARYYVHDWYAKKRETVESIDSERSAVQAYEEELMQEALGIKPKKLLLSKRQLTEDEMKDLLRREDDKGSDKKGREAMGPQKKVVANEHGEQVATSNEEVVAVAAREAPIKGIGFASHRTSKLEEIKAKTLGTVSSLEGTKTQGPIEVKLEAVKDEFPGGSSSSSSGLRIKEEGAEVKQEVKDEVKQEEQGDEASVAGSKRRRTDEDSEERRHKKAVKKEAKEEKKDKKRRKAEKELRKAEKKLRKAQKRSARDSSS